MYLIQPVFLIFFTRKKNPAEAGFRLEYGLQYRTSPPLLGLSTKSEDSAVEPPTRTFVPKYSCSGLRLVRSQSLVSFRFSLKPKFDFVAILRLFSPSQLVVSIIQTSLATYPTVAPEPLFYDALLRLPLSGSIASNNVPGIRSLRLPRKVFVILPKKLPVTLKPPLPRRPRPGIGLSV